jgi:FkbM family methyltransferase
VRIKRSLIPIHDSHRKALIETLQMYDRGEELSDSPLIKSRISLLHQDSLGGSTVFDRQEKFIALYESIKESWNDSSFQCWFDNDGQITLWDGFHRIAILEHLNLNPDLDVRLDWKWIDGSTGNDFPLVDVLKKEPPSGECLYQPIDDPRVKGWYVDRPDSAQRLEYVLNNLTGETVLDIGCSGGFFTRELAKRGYAVTAIDNRPRLLAVNRYLCTIQNLEVDFRLGDWQKIVNDLPPFDNVLFLSVIHNDMKQIGMGKGLQKLWAFRDKAKRLFFEVPNNDNERQWNKEGYPNWDFHKLSNLQAIEKITGLDVVEEYSGSRSIFTFSNEPSPYIKIPMKAGFTISASKAERFITHWMLETHEWEPNTTKFITENLKEGQTFVDIGANSGFFTLLASKLGAKAYAFEPASDTYEVLRENTQGLDNVTTYNIALSNFNGEADFYGGKNTGQRGLTTDMMNGTEVWERVKVSTLDDFNIKPDMIKIDTEGNEGDVIKGAGKSISNDTILIVEEGKNLHDFQIIGKATDWNPPNYFLKKSSLVALRIKGKNFGDLLNIPILRHYFGDIEFKNEIWPHSRVLVGIGTLIGYIVPDEWYLDKDVTFLGTGSRDTGKKVDLKAKGFVRGKLTEQKTGLPALGDIGILVDRIYNIDMERRGIGVCLDKTDKRLSFGEYFTAWVGESDLYNVCKNIASREYVITDKLHVAVAAESYHVPWVLVNHGDKTLSRTPDKFRDWAEMIGKERFIIKDLDDWEIVKGNTDFTESEKQKVILDAELKRIADKPLIGARKPSKPTYHLLGLAHTQTNPQYTMDSINQNVVELANMLSMLGVNAYHYGAEGSEVPIESVDCISLKEQEKLYGKDRNTIINYKRNDAVYQAFNQNAIREIKKRLTGRDILLVMNGYDQKAIADSVKAFPVEAHIGYSGIYAKERVFQSYAWMHYLYGVLSKNGGAGDGSYYDAVIPCSLNPDDYTFRDEKDDYILFLGRLIPRKGIHIAQQVADKVGVKLKVAGMGDLSGVTDKSPYVEHLGIVGSQERADLLSRAKALIAPTIYTEPFGRIIIEAGISGTPVITTDWGAFPETVVHGVTGYRCRTLDDFVWAVKNIHKIKSQNCHKHVLRNYSRERVSKMFGEYFSKINDRFDNGWYQEHPERKNLDWLRRY